MILLLAACGGKHQGPAPLTIAITADGFVKVDGKALTLDELGTLLAARRDAAPLEEFAGGARASSLPVRLDVEDDALWRHVNWVMTVLAEQRFWRLALPGGRNAPLPIDSTGCGTPPVGKALLVRILVRQDGVYALGDRTTRDVAEVGTWIDAAPLAGIRYRIGMICARPRVPWRAVRPICDLLRERGVERIQLWDVRIPTREERRHSPLPPPRAELYRPSPGLVEVDYWSKWYFEEEPELSPEEDLTAILDGHRLDLGLSRFGSGDPLWKAARLHANEMDRMGYFGHFSPTPGNRSPSDRLAKVGWPEESRHSELLAKAESAEAAFAAILAKPENAAILADPAFKFAGVAQSGDCWVVLLGAEP